MGGEQGEEEVTVDVVNLFSKRGKASNTKGQMLQN